MTSARRGLVLILGIFICGLVLFASRLLPGADTNLPTARQLVAEALALSGEANEDNSLPRSKIAVALGYIGDMQAARSILDAHQNDLWIDTANDDLDEIEIER